jgi:hypothetical protein
MSRAFVARETGQGKIKEQHYEKFNVSTNLQMEEIWLMQCSTQALTTPLGNFPFNS